MAIEWLAGNRLRGTTAERPALSLPSGSVGGWKEIGRASNASLPNVTGLADKRYLMFLNFQESNASRPAPAIRVNGDTGSNYVRRGSANGLSDYTNLNQTQIMFGGQPEQDTTTVPYFTVGYIANLAGKEKLAMCNNALSYQLGASGSDPLERRDTAFKWANTSDAVDQLSITNFLSGSFNTNGELVVLGWDPTDTHTTNFWEELASVDLSGGSADLLSSGTISAKKYLWVQFYVKKSGSIVPEVSFNDSTANEYAYRFSDNGASDGAVQVNKSAFRTSTDNTNSFVNMFIINNSSTEKLAIVHSSDVTTTGAGTAPSRREIVAKWTGSSQITKIDIDNVDSGSFDTASTMKVWGAD